MLSLAPICTEKLSTSTFGNKKCESTELERVSFNLKNSKEKIEVEALCIPFICLPIKKQSVEFAKNNFWTSKRVKAGWLKVYQIFIGLLVTENVKFGTPGEPVGVETKFGWVFNDPMNGVKNDIADEKFVSTL